MTAELFAFPALQPRTIKKANGYSSEFETFWLAYPRKMNCSKLMAFKAWNKLDPDEQLQAARALSVFVRSCLGKEEQYIPHAATWLNQRRFETVQIVQPQTTINIDWPTVLKIYDKTNNWNPVYGPAPDQPGYLGPKLP
jgi:hypothetical protein